MEHALGGNAPAHLQASSRRTQAPRTGGEPASGNSASELVARAPGKKASTTQIERAVGHAGRLEFHPGEELTVPFHCRRRDLTLAIPNSFADPTLLSRPRMTPLFFKSQRVTGAALQGRRSQRTTFLSGQDSRDRKKHLERLDEQKPRGGAMNGRGGD